MATWTQSARRAWAEGIRSEKQNGLDSQQLLELREKIDEWTDQVDLEAKRKLSMGKRETTLLFVTIIAEAREVKEVVFSSV